MNIRRVGVELWPGAESMGYEVTSESMAITVADLGAHLSSVVLRLPDDDELEIAVGYPVDAVDGAGSHGASIGRYANRIAGARFELDGNDYSLEPNEGPNQLHGGPEGFETHAWSAAAEQVGDTGRVTLRHTSNAGDMGFPGNVQATAVFELTDNLLKIDYRATTSEPTPINLTTHTYWNLSGPGRLHGHRLEVAAPTYVEVDDANIPIAGPPKPVDGSRFDCRKPRSLESIEDAGGYDHCFVLDRRASTQATLRHVSGRRIDLTTDQIGLQVYTGLHLPAERRGIAFEPQFLPDTPNRTDFGDCTVRPGNDYLSATTFVFR